jgi:hypothetical protein
MAPNKGFQSLLKAIQNLPTVNDDEDFVDAPPKKRYNIEGDKLIFLEI